MGISKYYQQTFRTDLAAFMGPTSVPYFGQSWHIDCHGLDKVQTTKRPYFLICLYFTVLIDQFMHQHYWPHYQRFAELTRYPKFCHGLGQFHHNPRGILSAPIERGLVSRHGVHSQLESGMELFVTEVTSFIREYLPDISPVELFRTLSYDPDVQIPLLIVMLDKTIAESTDYLAYAALQKAIKNASSNHLT